MSWVSENKFLTGFGAVMLAGLGTLGYLTYAAMDKYEAAMGTFGSANSQLKTLQETKPSLTNAHLKELLAQKLEMTGKIAAFQNEVKRRVLPFPLPGDPITPAKFQDKLKDTVAEIAKNAAAANVERPKDFYMGFGEYQSRPPSDKAAPALARELHAIELVMNVLIKTGSIELEEFHRDPLPEEGMVKRDEGATGSGRRRGTADGSDHGLIERNGLKLKFTSSDDALRKILTELANHKQQLFIVRSLVVQNKQPESPPRLAAAAPAAPAPSPEAPAATPIAPAAPAAPVAPAPATPPPGAPAPVANEGPLAYVFGMEKITATIELEVLNIGEPNSKSEKPEKGGKKKDK